MIVLKCVKSPMKVKDLIFQVDIYLYKNSIEIKIQTNR